MDTFTKIETVGCEFCATPIPIGKDTKTLDIQTEEGPAILLICPTCGRLQRPRIFKDGKLNLVDFSDEEMVSLQKVFNSKREKTLTHKWSRRVISRIPDPILFLVGFALLFVGLAAYEGWREYEFDKYAWELCHDPDKREELQNAQNVMMEAGFSPDTVCQSLTPPHFRLRFGFLQGDPYDGTDYQP